MKTTAIASAAARTAAIALALSAGLWFAALTLHDHKQQLAIEAGATEPLAQAQTFLSGDEFAPATHFIRLAEVLSGEGDAHDDIAARLLREGLARRPSDGEAWALLAFVETRRAGRFNLAAQDALKQSMAVCPYCDRDLMRWRLEFVLRHWEETPRGLRIAAFSGADVLRWWHLDSEWLGQIRTAAIRRGIDFDGYRRAIDTPVRPQEVGRPALVQDQDKDQAQPS